MASDGSEFGWIVWPAGAGWKQFALCIGDENVIIQTLLAETARQLDAAISAAFVGAKEDGRAEAIAVVRAAFDKARSERSYRGRCACGRATITSERNGRLAALGALLDELEAETKPAAEVGE